MPRLTAAERAKRLANRKLVKRGNDFTPSTKKATKKDTRPEIKAPKSNIKGDKRSKGRVLADPNNTLKDRSKASAKSLIKKGNRAAARALAKREGFRIEDLF